MGTNTHTSPIVECNWLTYPDGFGPYSFASLFFNKFAKI